MALSNSSEQPVLSAGVSDLVEPEFDGTYITLQTSHDTERLWPVVLCKDTIPPADFMRTRPSHDVRPAVLLGRRKL